MNGKDKFTVISWLSPCALSMMQNVAEEADVSGTTSFLLELMAFRFMQRDCSTGVQDKGNTFGSCCSSILGSMCFSREGKQLSVTPGVAPKSPLLLSLGKHVSGCSS